MKEKRILEDYPGSYYDIRGLEKWLTKMAAKGFRLEVQTGNVTRLRFRRADPAQVRFLLIPDIEKGDRAYGHMCNLYAEHGWKFICCIKGQVLIYETEDLWAVKPTVNLPEKAYHRKWRSLRFNMLLWAIAMCVMIGVLVWGLLHQSVAYYDRITIWPMTFVVSTLGPLLLAFVDIVDVYDVYAWWKHYRQEEEVPQWRGAMMMRWTKRVSSWMLLGMTLLLLPMELIAETPNRRAWDLEQDHVPQVTLEMVDGGTASSSCSGYRKKWMLLPEEVRVMTLRARPGSDWWDYLECTYYRLWDESMAHHLAESMSAEEKPWSYGTAAAVETDSGFDAVWLAADGGGGQYLTACTGDMAVVIETTTGDLLAALPEIYDAVIAYRTGT